MTDEGLNTTSLYDIAPRLSPWMGTNYTLLRVQTGFYTFRLYNNSFINHSQVLELYVTKSRKKNAIEWKELKLFATFLFQLNIT